MVPSLFLASRSAPSSIRAMATSVLPNAAAIANAVSLLPSGFGSFKFKSVPAAMCCLTASRSPTRAASKREISGASTGGPDCFDCTVELSEPPHPTKSAAVTIGVMYCLTKIVDKSVFCRGLDGQQAIIGFELAAEVNAYVSYRLRSTRSFPPSPPLISFQAWLYSSLDIRPDLTASFNLPSSSL